MNGNWTTKKDLAILQSIQRYITHPVHHGNLRGLTSEKDLENGYAANSNEPNNGDASGITGTTTMY
jgi:hypothetical protein